MSEPITKSPSRHALLALGLVAGCVQSPAEPSTASAPAPAEEAKPTPYPTEPSLFTLKKEPQVPCGRREKVDVNLGHSPEAFINLAHCQITGTQADPELVKKYSAILRHNDHVRRVDIVRTLCLNNKRKCDLEYSDPWVDQVELSGAPDKKVKRDVGAVFMFFFNCPGETNCDMNWANTHAPGMNKKHSLFGFGDAGSAHYDPKTPGFWRRELMDAQYAGLQFLMLNTYGPDIADGKLKPLVDALESIDDPIKIAYFDDTWTWGEPWFGPFWEKKPDLGDPDSAADTIYEAKWKPFFSQVPKEHWYRFKGRPFIYFYNSGKLTPRNKSAAVLSKLKERFMADFGEEPFLDVDTAYFEDKAMKDVADAEFRWFTFQAPGMKSRSTHNGHVIDHAMVKWDAVNRDRPGGIANKRDLMIKDGRVLEKVLDDSRDAELLVLATWNDLGEGTGINRNYDYYVEGQWLEPHHFMNMIRRSQSGQ